MSTLGWIEVLDIEDGEWWSAQKFMPRLARGDIDLDEFEHGDQIRFLVNQAGEPRALEPFYAFGFFVGCLRASRRLVAPSCFAASGDEEETWLIVSDGEEIRVLWCAVGAALGTIINESEPLFAPALPGAVEAWRKLKRRRELLRVSVTEWLNLMKCWGEQYRELLRILVAVTPAHTRSTLQQELGQLQSGLEQVNTAFEMLESRKTVEGGNGET